MMSLQQIAAAVAAVGAIGGSAITLDHLHVSAKEFEQYIQQQIAADEQEYVLELKKEIRAVRSALISRPDDEYLLELLDDLMMELCEIRPEDRMCGQ